MVNKVRWALDAKKAGHAGTLDPEATGVLAVALGEATKTVPYITDALKAYEFTVRLGAATNTDDAEGEVIETSDLRPDDDDQSRAGRVCRRHRAGAAAILRREDRRGTRLQTRPRRRGNGARGAPPLGRRALLLTDRPDADHVTLEMICGKGGYVRSIARDLGAGAGLSWACARTAPHLVRAVRRPMMR